ncbi:MAG: hypothetical protein WCI53_09200 [Bacteroidota bacterium]|jgi:hypothetical protein
MKKYIFTALAIIFTNIITAQTTDNIEISNKPYQFQAGINVISFVRQFVNFSGSNNNIATSPYSINFKALKKLDNKNSLIGLRLGSGYSNTNFSDANATNSNSTFIESLDIRIGIEYQKMITKRWTAFAGFDYISQKATNNTESKFTNSGTEFISTNKRTTLMDGAGFIFGMQFNLNKYLALSTEASYYYTDSWSRSATFSSNNSNNQPPSISKNTTTSLILPNVLHFTLLF